MKTLKLICPLVALALSSVTHAAPVQYQITATVFDESEYLENGTEIPLTTNTLFAYDTPISTTFFYDATTVATSTNNPADPWLYSYFTGAATNFSGTVLSYSFSSSSADAAAYDLSSDASYLYLLDSVEIFSGEWATSSSPARTNLNGFSIGDFTLVGAAAFSDGLDMLPDQSLPTDLSATSSFAGAGLLFKNPAGNIRRVLFFNGNITPVPVPSALGFFLSGLVGLGANALRKQNKK